MFEDLIAHLGFTFLALGSIAVAVLWMVYRTEMDKEQTDIMYAEMDLLSRILEKLEGN